MKDLKLALVCPDRKLYHKIDWTVQGMAKVPTCRIEDDEAAKELRSYGWLVVHVEGLDSPPSDIEAHGQDWYITWRNNNENLREAVRYLLCEYGLVSAAV